ncbi:MAG: metallophosphoesterase family protein [Candidatus Omnitrophica bacterium]|nr:metallophosphoesterase family protein [Candidatus Omnitrophota bacterium]
MKIIAISDTHSEPLPKALLTELKTVDLIVHAGDFCEPGVFHQLKGIKDVRAVYGNMDGLELRDILPKHTVIECDGVRIGLAHGDGAVDGIIERLQTVFKGQHVDCVIFGHSHQPYQGMIDGVLFFNPGSPTDMLRAPYRSYGVLDIKAGKIKAHIVRLK